MMVIINLMLIKLINLMLIKLINLMLSQVGVGLLMCSQLRVNYYNFFFKINFLI